MPATMPDARAFYNALSWRHKLRIFLLYAILLKTAVEKTQEDGFPSWRSSMSNVCTLCSGPIETLDTHEFCIQCLGLAHAEAALTGSSCPHCKEFSVRVLRALRNVVLSDFSQQHPTAASEPLVGLTASEKDWAHTPEERSEVEGHAACQDELVRILTRAVSDLSLEWESPDEPAKSKLDSGFSLYDK